jgi:hypothetical protein
MISLRSRDIFFEMVLTAEMPPDVGWQARILGEPDQRRIPADFTFGAGYRIRAVGIRHSGLSSWSTKSQSNSATTARTQNNSGTRA